MEGMTTQEIAERSAGNLLPVPWIEASDVAEAVLLPRRPRRPLRHRHDARDRRRAAHPLIRLYLAISSGNASCPPSRRISSGVPSRTATASASEPSATPAMNAAPSRWTSMHVADPQQRARLVGDVAVARAQHDAQRRVERARGQRGLDVARSSGVTAANARADSSDSRRSTRRVRAAADHDRESAARRAKPTFSPSASVVDGDDRHAALAQQQAQPQPDLAEPDDDHVIAPRHRAPPESPVRLRVDEPVDQPAGEATRPTAA